MNDWNKQFFEKFKFEGLTFDDVLIIPQKSEVVPRDVDLRTRLSKNIPLNIPFVSADMDTVTEGEMAKEMAKAGGIGFLWKDPDIDKQLANLDMVQYDLNGRIDNPKRIYEEQRLEDVMKKLEEHGRRFSSLIVLNSDDLVVGLVTKHQTKFADLGNRVKDIMIKSPIMTEEDLDVHGAYGFMKEKKIGKLILVNKQRKLKGLYCWDDVKSIVEKINPIYNRNERGQLRVGANVGVHDYERVERLLKRKCDVLLVGTAHGDSKNVVDTVRGIKKNFSKYQFDLIAGNVATYEGAKNLCDAGADGIKVGVGPGSICTTRIVSGAGVPQITAISDVSKIKEEYDVPIIGDGGIVYSGDVTKAIVAGADCVMMGNALAGTKESLGEIIIIKGEKYITYRGMGSLGAMKSSESHDRYNLQEDEKLVAEGVEGLVPLVGYVADILYKFVGGLRSGMGYAGAKDIKTLQETGRFLKPTKSGQAESKPHHVEDIKE